jgi:hypothetical protein
VDPAGGGDVSECKVIYGVDTKYELGSAPCDEAVPYSAATPIEAEITGLQTLTNYHYRVVVKGPGGTVRSADHTLYLAPEMPILGAVSVGDVTDTEAKVEAHINPDAGPTIYRIQYGTTQAYGSQTLPSESIGSDETEHAVETELTGLEPGKLYHFRVAATNFGGTVFGSDYTFTTLGPPELGGVSVSNLGPSFATLAIQVNPNLSPTSYRVDYGTGANYGSQSAEVALPDTENIFHEVTVQLSGLSPGTTYHLRAVATNAIGTAATFDQTLTTAAEPPHVAEPAPPPVVKCKKGFVKRKGKCVKQPHHRRKHHEKGHRHG